MFINKNNSSGFTLVEILLAVVIFGIVTTTLYFSYNSLFQAREKIEQKTEILSGAETALFRIVEDLLNFYCETGPLYREKEDFGDKSKYFFYAENTFNQSFSSTEVNFTSYAHLGFGKDNYKSPSEIFYYLKDNILYRGDFVYPYPESREEKENRSYPLCKNVKKFKMTFYDEENQKYESWNSDDQDFEYATPKMVKLELEIELENDNEKFETKIRLPVFREKKE
ncbi:MAG: type II secretion system protein GspJ [Thermodesulfobacteriota bacterium]